MAVELGTVTYGTTGNKNYTLSGAPKWVRVTVGSRFGTTDAYFHESTGFYDGTNCMCVSKFMDTTGGRTVNSSSKIFSVLERVSGSITVVLEGSVSFSGNNIVFNVTTANSNYQLIVESEY